MADNGFALGPVVARINISLAGSLGSTAKSSVLLTVA